MDKVSMLQPNFFSRYQTKCVKFLIQTIDDIINFKIFLGSACKAIADREKKKGRGKYTNLNISRIKRAF